VHQKKEYLAKQESKVTAKSSCIFFYVWNAWTINFLRYARFTGYCAEFTWV